MIVSTTLAGPGAEHTIEDALRSVAPLVDGFLIFLSGCDPHATAALVHRLSTELGKTSAIQHLAWPDDYGKARNFALSQAEALGATWALTVDTDERVEIDPAQLAVLEMPDFDVFCVHDRDLLYQKPRFIRCGAGAIWYGIVHERLTSKGRQGSLVGSFWELKKTPEAEARRWRRGLVEVPKMLAEKECPSLRRHLAECLLSAGMDDEARAEFERVLADPQAPLHEQTWCRYRLAEFEAVARRWESAQAIASTALGKDPGFIQELGWVLAHCAAKLGQYQTAALWADYALRAPIDYSRGGHRGATWKEGCQHLLESIQRAAEAQFPSESDTVRESPRETSYTAAHWQARDEYRDDYFALARALCETLSFSSHLDLGAGNGLLVEAMHGCQVISSGIELSVEAEAYCGQTAGSCIRFGVGVESWATGSAFDLVSSVEVLEHLPEAKADEAVRAICARSSRYVYFSAASPGQGGIAHVNEQPQSYWREKFRSQGFHVDVPSTERLRVALSGLRRCPWLARNAMIFSKGAA